MTSSSKIAGSRALIIAAFASVLIIVLLAGIIANDNLHRLEQDVHSISAQADPAELSVQINRLREHFQSSYRMLITATLVVVAVCGVFFWLANASLNSRQRDELAQTIVLAVTKFLSSNPPAAEALTEALSIMCRQLSLSTGAFWEFDETKEELRCLTFYSSEPCPNFEPITRAARFQKGEGLPGRVWEKNTPLWIPDVVHDKNFPRAKQAQSDGFHAAFGFPVTLGDKVIGVFEFFSKKIAEPDRDLLGAFSIVGSELGQFFERRRIERELLASESRFREFANVVDEVFFVSSPTLTEHYYVSPAYEKVWGSPVSEVYANPSLWAEQILPDHKQRVIDYVQRLGNPEMPESEIEYPILRKDGRIAWLSARVFRIQLDDGTWHSCGTVRDITEKKEFEQRMSDFYTMMSHELRTPLTSIKGSLLLLERGKAGELSDEAKQLVQLGRRESERVIRLINDMLDMKKLEAGKLVLYRQNLDPSDVVAQTIEAMEAFAREHKITLKCNIAAGAPKIYADKDLLVQVITNLVANAIRFSPENSEVLVGVESLDNDANMVRFTVRDTGPGISQANQEKLFQPFQQVPQRDGASKEGSGLGLAICKGIVDEHEGRIGVVSAEGMGATFWFNIPIAQQDQSLSNPPEGA